jgi:tetratricopeptide (TPR) repeat protein/predicted  nucleic acid-binding Zn-ribbon protein
MRLKAIPLLLLGVLSILTPELRAQTAGESAADRFLNGYQLFQKAESLEGNKDYAGALRTLKEALKILDDITAQDKTWNPGIVEYRRKRIVEGLARLEPKVAGSGSAASADTIPGVPGLPLPESGPISGGVDLPPDILPGPSKAKAGSSRTTPQPATGPLDEIRRNMDDLREKVRQAQEERDTAQRSARDMQAKLDKAAEERRNVDKQLKIMSQRSDVAEQALMDERKKKTADAEKLLNLQTQAAKLKKEVTSLRDERDALEELRNQEGSRHRAVVDRANKAAEASATFKKTLEDLEKSHKSELAAVQQKLTKTEAERDGLQVKLTAVTAERDSYKSQVAKLQEDKKNLDKALADNATLMAKLSDAEKQIIQFKADNAQKDVLIADLKKEIASVNKQLTEAKQQSASYQAKMAELQANLQSTAENLALATTTGKTNAADKKKLQEENEILRGIATRQLKAQAGRDQARKLILAELAKMEIKSKDLLSRINFLGEPVVKLSPKEAALFKKPDVQVGDNEIALAAPKQDSPEAAAELPKADAPAEVPPPAAPPAPVAVATATPAPLTPPVAAATPAKAIPVAKAVATPTKTTTPAATPAPAPLPIAVATPARSAAPAKAETPELAMLDTSRINRPSSLDTPRTPAPTSTSPSSEPRTEPATGGNVTETGAGASTVPAELQPTAQAAKDNFDRGNYGAAEKLYETILAKAPTNLYALSNLGVVQFRQGKLKLAEGSFRKAIAIAPEDAFSRCTLGIIYYSQNRYDEAVNELTKSLAINPKYAAAHNFLGITACQKGWQEAAQKELETATSLDPNYPDAHNNLPVVSATQQPANKQNARKFYQRATELGAEKDASLEALLK